MKSPMAEPWALFYVRVPAIISHSTMSTNHLRSIAAVVFALCVTTSRVSADQLNLTQYVNPFIGTAWTEQPTHDFAYDCGNTFPGAAYPMGMIQWSPDTPGTKGVMGGYFYPDRTITGFPLTHFSG